MKYRILFFLFGNFLFFSCSDYYEQRYKNFNDFDNANLRNKSWFPDIISADAYNFHNISYLDPLCAFGVFSYSNNRFYDSVFTDSGTTQAVLLLFEEKVKEHLKRKPDWFLNPEALAITELQTLQLNRFILVRVMKEKKIYFIVSN